MSELNFDHDNVNVNNEEVDDDTRIDDEEEQPEDIFGLDESADEQII